MPGLIIWINGAFGIGKTQTAGELYRRLPGSFIYDPENFGFWMRKNEPRELHTEDFQDEPLWRDVSTAMLSRIAHGFDGIVIVPMTLTTPAYYEEIIGSLRREGLEVIHVQLTATRETLLRRQRSRLDGPDSWAARHIPRCLVAFENPLFENKIPTDGLSIPEVAERVAEICGLTLLPRRNFLRSKLDQLLTSLGAIRR